MPQLRDDRQLEAEQVGGLADAGQLVSDTERDVVRRSFGAPGVEERPWPGREPDPRVRVADPERRPGDRLSLRGDQLQPAAGRLRQADDRHRAELDLHLDREARPRLAVVELERAGDRATLGDREMTGAVVTHEDELVVEV